MKTDIFWYNDVSILINPEHVYEIIPFPEYSLERKLNSLVRLGALVFILLSLILKNINILLLFFVTLLITYLVYFYYKKSESFTENENTGSEVRPTPNNPFMNITPDDYLNRPNRELPENMLTDKNIQKEI